MSDSVQGVANEGREGKVGLQKYRVLQYVHIAGIHEGYVGGVLIHRLDWDLLGLGGA